MVISPLQYGYFFWMYNYLYISAQTELILLYNGKSTTQQDRFVFISIAQLSKQ